MIFGNENKPVEQTGKGLNKPDGFGNIPEHGGETKVIVCPKCGQITVYSSEIIGANQVERKCPKCGTILGIW